MTKSRKVDQDSEHAAAQLWRLSQAHALIRMFRETEGYEPPSAKTVGEWATQRQLRNVRPSDDDVRAAELEHARSGGARARSVIRILQGRTNHELRNLRQKVDRADGRR